MKFFLPKDLTYLNINVAENETETGGTYTDFNVMLGVNEGAVRKYGQNIYEALTTIYPLCHYIWEDLIYTDRHAKVPSTGQEIYPTNGQILIPITNGVTIVYVRSNNTFYKAKVTATVDFMTESITSPSNFDAVTATPAPYRYNPNFPVGETDTLFWGYNGVANKYRALDRAVGTQTVKSGAGPLTMSFSVNSINAISFFYLDATSIEVKVYDTIDPNNPVLFYDKTVDLTDTSHLNTYEKVCTIPERYGVSSTFDFDARYSMRVDITISKISGDPKVGAIKAGLLDYLGQTLDGVSLGGKSYNTSEQRPNGEVVWNKDNKESNKVKTLGYNVKVDTGTFDAVANMVSSILDKEVVLLGDDGDPEGFTTLNSYGAITGHSGELTSNNTKSKLSISIENFT